MNAVLKSVNFLLFLLLLNSETRICRAQTWKQQTQTQQNAAFYGHYLELRAANAEQYIYSCNADTKCAAACFSSPAVCRLYKFGFEKVARATCASQFIKPEVQVEMDNINRLGETFSLVKPRAQLIGQPASSVNFLRPYLCFNACMQTAECAAASFTIDPRSPTNCMIYRQNQYKESNEVNELWTSYVKIIDSSTTRLWTTTTRRVEVSTQALATSSSQKRPMTASQPRQRQTMKNVKLVKHYKEFDSTSQDECFETCDIDNVCAAACHLSPNTCRFFKLGFEQLNGNPGSSAYIKPEVKPEITNTLKLNDTFPLVKLNTKLISFYYELDTLAPSQCFLACQQITNCGGASFTKDTNLSHNCFLSRPGSNVTTHMMWISFTKSETEFSSSKEINPVSTASLEQTVLNRTRLTGNLYDTQNASSASECFDKCETDAKCAAASFTSSECSLLKFGFEKESDVSDCTAYIKLEVVVDMTGMEKLTNKFPIVKLKTRLLGFYSNIDTLTPSHCFEVCKMSAECGGATFTVDAKKPQNCFLSQPGKFSEKVWELWTSYVKSTAVQIKH